MPTVIGDHGKPHWSPEDDPILNDPMCKGVPRDVVIQFINTWFVYPARRGGNPRRMALRSWIARWREGIKVADLHRATVNYRKYCEAGESVGTPYVMHAQTFYGPNERWKDFLESRDDQPADEVISEIRSTWLKGGRP